MDREFLEQVSERLSATRTQLVGRLRSLVGGRTMVDDELLDEIEELLLESDMGVQAAEAALQYLRDRAQKDRLRPEEILDALASYFKDKLGPAAPLALQRGQLQVVLLVGVNGTGKTTTAGKLANRLAVEGFAVVLAAADTFRAAAIDQLAVWAERAKVPLIRHEEGSDAAAVVFDALAAARSRGADVVLVDTAGRLHNKANLMAELRKIRNVIDLQLPGAAVDCLLVLDATTGQNGLRQAEVFAEATKLTGCILTKLDGTAKGGVVFAIGEQLGLPVRLVGLGEGLEDLRDFNPDVFVDAMFAQAAPGPD
ncbi:MAG: signal recognition particle-docking protein FtsY [Cyanobacteria bacterium REEB65]|nr:signal recognition particle-docking protein FtsY [Cyanobacteria bacterium REEB65]